MRTGHHPTHRNLAPWRRLSKAALAALISISLLMLPGQAVAGTPGTDGYAPAANDGDQDVLDEDTFQNPGPDLQPGFTWWWPGPAVEDSELKYESRLMAKAGFGTSQLFEAPRLGLPQAGNPPETYMWGTQHWADRIRTALEAAKQNGTAIGIQASSGWPWTSPAVAGDNVALSAQHLGYAQQPITGPMQFTGPPPAALDATDRRLVAVTAARPDPAGVDPEGHIRLDTASTIDLTSTLDADGNIHWTVPQGDWILFGFWHAPTRSSGAADNGVGYVLDYLNPRSTQAAHDYLDDHLFSNLGNLPAEAGDTFHEDSLEGVFHEGPNLLWTADFLKEFRNRRGYDLRRYLPALAYPEGFAYTFPDGAGERVRHDYTQTLSELWVENHVIPTRQWANGHGLEASGRAFGADDLPLDLVEIAKSYDIPDVDHITNSTIDWTRTTTSGARLSGNNVASSELGDLVGADYAITLETLKRIGDRQLVGGANQLDIHGFPYQTAFGSRWPSWWPWSSEYPPISGVSEGWTPKMPQWRTLPRLADYFARAQTVLRTGEPVTDVAIYRDAQGFKPQLEIIDKQQPGDAFEPLVNTALTRSGYTFDIVNPTTVDDPSTRVQGQRLIVQDPGYKALVIDLDASRRIGAVDNSNAMSASTARRLVNFANSGLPIVFVGQYPTRGTSLKNPAVEDRVVNQAIAKLKVSSNVRLAEHEADIPQALADLGVRSDLEFSGTDKSADPCGFGAQCIYSVRRHTADGDYWFLWNAGNQAETFTGSFAVDGHAPQIWDMWSGDKSDIANYKMAGGRTAVPLKLGSLESVVIGFDHPVTQHVVDTDAERVVSRDGALYLRSTDADGAAATLDDGRHVSVDLPQIPASIEPASWQLHVDGALPEGEETHDLVLNELKDWREIADLTRTSGTGTYRSTISLPPNWVGDGRGAYLDLGRIAGGAVQVRVNDTLVNPVAVVTSRLDIGPYLLEGDNEIEVEFDSTLRNRLVEQSSHVNWYRRFRNKNTQAYGLIGPVTVIPYAEAKVPARTDTDLTLSPSSTVVGSSTPTVVTATVASSEPVTTGKVEFTVDGTKLAEVPVTAGHAQATMPNLTVGPHRIGVRYLGAEGLDSSTSPVKTLTVTKAISTTTGTLAKSRVRKGKSASVDVTVAAPGVTPTGPITVTANGKIVKSAVLTASANGAMRLTISGLKIGKYTIRVDYAGDSNVQRSTSPAGTLRVVKKR